MCKILMPINPQFVEEILTGRKKYEYRKTKAKRDKIEWMVIYSTYPVMKVVAEVEIKSVLEEEPKKIWDLTKEYSGVSKEFYYQYYQKKDIAVAYELGKVIKYDTPMDLKDLGVNYIPQSFIYLD